MITELAHLSQKVGFLQEALFFWNQAESREDGFSGKTRDIWTKIGECHFFMGDLKACQYWFGRVAGIVGEGSNRGFGFGYSDISTSKRIGNYRQTYVYGVLSLCRRLEEVKSSWNDRGNFLLELDMFSEQSGSFSDLMLEEEQNNRNWV